MAEGNEQERPPVPGGTEEAAVQERQEEPRVRWRKREEEAGASRQDGTGPSDEQQELLERELLQQRVAVEQQKAEEAVSRLQRVQADFINYKRRSEQEREGQARFATMVLVKELLPILDNFDRALATMPEEVKSLPWTEGLLLVDRSLRATLERQGLKPIEAVGMRFDPTLHEAIIHEESADHADDEVIAELQRGYMLHDKVVRPSLVKVAKHVAQ